MDWTLFTVAASGLASSMALIAIYAIVRRAIDSV